MPVILQTSARGFSRMRLRRTLASVLKRLRLEDAELSVVIVREAGMIAANRRFFGRSEPTDVISISQLDGGTPSAPERLIGDVIVSMDAAREQARRFGHSLQRELDILCVHGLLHNLGMDDRTPSERRAMMARTRRLLAR